MWFEEFEHCVCEVAFERFRIGAGRKDGVVKQEIVVE